MSPPAERRRHQGRRHAAGRHRQQVRGRVRRPPRRLLVPVRLHGELLRRPHHRLQRAGRPVPRPSRARTSTSRASPLTDSRAGGTPVLNQNGNRWVGAGHNASPPTWPARTGSPTTRSTGPTPTSTAPTASTSGRCCSTGSTGSTAGPRCAPARGRATAPSGPGHQRPASPRRSPPAPARRGSSAPGGRGTDAQSGSYLRSAGAGAVLTRSSAPGDVRAEADLRSSGAAYGLVVARARPGRDPAGHRPPGRHGDRCARRARRHRRARPRCRPASTPPTGTPPRLERRGGTVTAQLSNARLGDPVVDLRIAAAPGAARRRAAGRLAGGAGRRRRQPQRAARPRVPVTRARRRARAQPARPRRQRRVRRLGASAPPGSGCGRDAAATVVRRRAALADRGRRPDRHHQRRRVLLRDPAPGAWTAETKVSIDLGTDTVRNFQQAGLIAYVNDDLFTRLSHVAIWNTRQTEFGKEMPYAGRLSYGGTIVGPPGGDDVAAADPPRRRPHRRARAARVDQPRRPHLGQGWRLDAARRRPTLRVGLVSHGGAGATADFDYLRIYRD